MKNTKRIAIVGCPGSGKTTFARILSEKVNIPVIHLDYYYHQLKYGFHNDREAWIEKVKQLVKQDSWIMDGNYSSSFDVRFKEADSILFFDYPRRTSMYGVIKRRIQYHNKLREEMPSDWKEKADMNFIKYVWNFKKVERIKITNALDKVKNKEVVIFKNRKDADDYLKSL